MPDNRAFISPFLRYEFAVRMIVENHSAFADIRSYSREHTLPPLPLERYNARNLWTRMEPHDALGAMDFTSSERVAPESHISDSSLVRHRCGPLHIGGQHDRKHCCLQQ